MDTFCSHRFLRIYLFVVNYFLYENESQCDVGFILSKGLIQSLILSSLIQSIASIFREGNPVLLCETIIFIRSKPSYMSAYSKNLSNSCVNIPCLGSHPVFNISLNFRIFCLFFPPSASKAFSKILLASRETASTVHSTAVSSPFCSRWRIGPSPCLPERT